MSQEKPSRDEILERYRHLIPTDDFKILEMDSLPDPSLALKNKTECCWLGKIRGFLLFLTKNPVTAVWMVIVVTGQIEGSMQFAERVTNLTQEVAAAIDVIKDPSNLVNADSFLVVVDGPILPKAPDQPAHREYFLLTGLPTGTTTPTIQLFDVPLPSGSEIIPVSKDPFRLT